MYQYSRYRNTCANIYLLTRKALPVLFIFIPKTLIKGMKASIYPLPACWRNSLHVRTLQVQTQNFGTLRQKPKQKQTS